MIRTLSLLLIYSLSSLALGADVGAGAGVEDRVPDSLKPWIPWVLGDDDRRACPLTAADGEHLCAWPGRLDLDLDDRGGLFAQHWRVYAESWVGLPGDAGHWPQDVRVGAEPAAVVARDGVPAVKLAPGDYAVSGSFQWRARPEGLAVPLVTGIVALRLGGVEVPFPRLERGGRLWLGEAPAGEADGGNDALSLQVYRRIDDDVPLHVVTRLEIDVSGRARELVLDRVLLDGGIPLRLESPLPARLEPDGGLRLQARPGRWVVEVTERHVGSVTDLSQHGHLPPWPDQEVWVFAAHPDLRQVEIAGADAVDPRQTRLPSDWARLPAYLMRADDRLRLNEIQRGDARPVPDRLTLSRDLWLDFGGHGYTLRDRINGELTRSWRLEAGPRLVLGQMVVDGEPRFITRVGESPGDGVEVRQGRLQLVADGRIDGDVRHPPASGWSLDLQSAETRLHLPPGWDLLAAGGVDNLPDTWVNRWTLLDLFLVLIIALATARLWGPGWGLAAIITMVLIWQEPEAPRLIWLNLLGAIALLRLLPTQPSRAAMVRLRGLLRLYYRASLLALAVIALPFLIDQVRNGIYPQLERPWPVLSAEAQSMRTDAAEPVAAAPAAMADMVAKSRPSARSRAPLAGAPRPVAVVDPGALVQTGPGVPAWRWRTVELGWHGSVPRDQGLTLWLLSPAMGLFLALLQLILVLLLALKLAGLAGFSGLSGAALRRTSGAAVVLLAVGLSAVPAPSVAAAFPPPELLEDLRTRLLEPPDCLPDCAAIPRMRVLTDGDLLRLELTVTAREAVALPIPGSADGWVPRQLTLDGVPLDGLRRDTAGGLSAPIPAGRHVLGLSGPLPPRAEVLLPLPLRPRQVEYRAAQPVGQRGEQWLLEGVDGNGRPAAQLRLLRRDPRGQGGDELIPSEVPPLLRVRRTLSLGVDWRIETEITRLSPPRWPVTVQVPLVPGEQVLTEEVRLEGDGVSVSLPPGRLKTAWTSSLEPVDSLVLHASEDAHLSEEWRVDASPLWHLEVDGIAPIHHRGQLRHWVPTWRPWPGEEVHLILSRPTGVPGPTLTLDRSLLRLAPGRRLTDAVLELTLRSSQGGRHRILLPPGAELRGVGVDGAERPLRLDDRALTLPLAPTTQQWRIHWTQPETVAALYSPPVPDVGVVGVNASLRVEPAEDRWILFAGGPGVGPAVLFWGLVVVLVPIAFALGRSAITPLKGRDWLLLGLGVSQAGIWVGLLVAGWLFALGLKGRLDRDPPPWRYNLTQVGVVLLGLAALSALLAAVHQGLLGTPQMQIAGNGSTAANLQWYLDRSLPELPRVWVVSVPMLVYRGLMLAWALWLAIQLLGWLRWGWRSLSEPILWRETGFRLPRRRRETVRGGDGHTPPT